MECLKINEYKLVWEGRLGRVARALRGGSSIEHVALSMEHLASSIEHLASPIENLARQSRTSLVRIAFKIDMARHFDSPMARQSSHRTNSGM